MLTEGEYLMARQMVGAMRPVQNASLLLEPDAYKGASVLPVLGIMKPLLQLEHPVDVARRGVPTEVVATWHADLLPAVQDFREKLIVELRNSERM